MAILGPEIGTHTLACVQAYALRQTCVQVISSQAQTVVELLCSPSPAQHNTQYFIYLPCHDSNICFPLHFKCTEQKCCFLD